VDDPVYRQRLATRLRSGKLSPAVECMLWHYAKGKPKEEVQSNQHITVSWQEGVTERLKNARKRRARRDDS
jgi:hypothetical protein